METREEFKDGQIAALTTLLNVLYALLGLSVIVSLFGIVNTLVLSVFERTRELGMLRAIGMTRRQARRMIRHESIVTALIGATLGIAVGIFLAALVTHALSDEGLVFALPFGTLAVFVLAAIAAGSSRRSFRRDGPRGSTCSRRCSTSESIAPRGREGEASDEPDHVAARRSGTRDEPGSTLQPYWPPRRGGNARSRSRVAACLVRHRTRERGDDRPAPLDRRPPGSREPGEVVRRVCAASPPGTALVYVLLSRERSPRLSYAGGALLGFGLLA